MPRWEIRVTTDTEALLRSAYDLAEGDRLDGEGFIDLFAENGVFNGIGGVSVQESYRGEQLGDVVVWLRPYEPPAGVIQPTEVKLDLPTADFWCAGRQGPRSQLPYRYDHYVPQLGVLPDFASAVAASVPER